MTDNIQKKFFDTFGIEPKEKVKQTFNGAEFKVETTKEYPQITERVLLEMICICSQYGFCPTARIVKHLKSKIFKRLFQLKKNLKNNYEHQGYHNAFVRKVRTLFKECE